ncbi:MAG: RNA pseudouridine synthase [bacterium]
MALIQKEAKDYLIVNKPAGLLTHPTEAGESKTLSGLLVKKYPELAQVGEDPNRPGIIHRLDKLASGLLVIPRNQAMFEHLKKQFQERTVDKEYSVLVHGRVLADENTIDLPLSHSKNTKRIAAVPKIKKGIADDRGRTALTDFWVEKRWINFTLLQVKIHTGRTHQIRVHMLAYNHPVVGDPIYFQKKQKRKWDDELGRLFLHCNKLGFVDLQGKKRVFKSKLPKKLEDFLKKIK